MKKHLEIAGLVKQSVLDYPDKLCATIFLQGCNFRCHYCQNPTLIPMQKKCLSCTNLDPETMNCRLNPNFSEGFATEGAKSS